MILNLKKYPTGMDIQEACWRAICFNGGPNEPASAAIFRAYKAWRGLLNADLAYSSKFYDKALSSPGPTERDSEDFIGSMQRYSQYSNDCRPFQPTVSICRG